MEDPASACNLVVVKEIFYLKDIFSEGIIKVTVRVKLSRLCAGQQQKIYAKGT